MLIHSIRDERSRLQKHFPFPLLSLPLVLDLPLSIFLFLRLKGFCERPGMKGCPQWKRDCRDSTSGLRYQNCSLRVAPPYRDCPQFVRHQKDAQFTSELTCQQCTDNICVHIYAHHIIQTWINDTLEKHRVKCRHIQKTLFVMMNCFYYLIVKGLGSGAMSNQQAINVRLCKVQSLERKQDKWDDDRK